MPILNIVFDEANGLIRVTDSDPSFASTHGILRIVDPQGVDIYKNTGFNAGVFTSPDLSSGSPEFTIGIPQVNGAYLEGDYTFEYKYKPTSIESEGDLIEKVAIWRPDRPKVCMSHRTSCICSKIELQDISNYGAFNPSSWSWSVAPPAVSSLATVTGTENTLVVGPNIWTGDYEAALTVTGTVDHGSNISSVLVLKGFSNVRVDCESKAKLYNTLASINSKYDTLTKTSPGEAAAYLETLQTATSIALLAEFAYELGNWNAYEAMMEKIGAMSPDCGCDDCDDCDDCGDEFPTEILPQCTSSSGGNNGGGGLDTEAIQDMLSSFLQPGANIDISYDDNGNILTISFTPPGEAGQMLRFNAVTGEWEAGGRNGNFVRVPDGSNYTVTNATPDPVIYAAELSSITLPDPTTVDKHFLVSVVCESTDATEPPETTTCSIVFPDGSFASIESDSMGLPNSKITPATSGFSQIQITNGEHISIGIVEVTGGVKKWAPVSFGSRFINDPKLPDLQGNFGNSGFGLVYDYNTPDKDGFLGTYRVSHKGRTAIKIGANGTVSSTPLSGLSHTYYLGENTIFDLPSVQDAFDKEYEVIIAHENETANQPYGTSGVEIRCGDNGQGDPADRFAAIGSTSPDPNAGVEPTRLSLNTNVHSLDLRNGEAIRLTPYVAGSIKRWVGIITNRFVSTGGSGSVTWGDVLGTLANQTDLQTALDAKLDANSYTAADVTSKYESEVDKVSGTEITNGTQTQTRRFSPADIVALIAAHESGGGSTGFLDIYDTRAALTTAHPTPPSANSWAIIKDQVELAVENSGQWEFAYDDAYSLDPATVTLLENDGNFTSGVYSGSAIGAADLIAGKRHTKTGSNNILYLCVNPASPYWVRMDVSGGGGGGGATNLGYIPAASNGTVTSDTGIDATIPAANATNAGLMTTAQFDKLSNVEDEATADMTGAEIETALDTQLGGTAWKTGGSGSTNLGYTPSATDGTVTSSSGTGATIPLGDGTNAGLESPAHWQIVEGAVDINGASIQDGDIIEYSSANVRFDPTRPEKVDATAGDVGSIKLSSPYFTNIYGAPNPHTLSTVVVDATTLREGGSAKIRIQSAAKPSTYTLAGATFTEVGDWSGWSASGVNVIGMECEEDGGSAIIKLYYAGVEA